MLPLIWLVFLAVICLVVGVIAGGGSWYVFAVLLAAAAVILYVRSRRSPNGAAPLTRGTQLRRTKPSNGGVADAADGPVDEPAEEHADAPDTVTSVPPSVVARATDPRVADPEVIQVPLMTDAEFADADAYAGPTAYRSAVEAPEVWVVDGEPDYHVYGCSALSAAGEPIPYEQALEDGFTACPLCEPDAVLAAATPVTSENDSADDSDLDTSDGDAELDEVWVMDGEPDYHLVACPVLDERAEAVPRLQAIEDGFTPCEVCEPESVTPFGLPNDEPEVEPEPEPAVAEAEIIQPEPEPVVPEPEPVVLEPEPESVPAAAPEPIEEPIAEEPIAEEPEPVATPATAFDTPLLAVLDSDVWVIDGKLRYHRGDCLMIKGQNAVPIPREQATDEGFQPCLLCKPDLDRWPTA